MNPIRRKMVSFLTEAAQEQLKALDPQCELAIELSEINDLEKAISEEIELFCKMATFSEIAKVVFMIKKLKKASPDEEDNIKSCLDGMADDMIRRMQAESSSSKLPAACHNLIRESILN